MSEMIERVAKAMAEETNGGDFRDGRWYTDDHRKLWHARARVAIEAMRKPTPAMEDAGDNCDGFKETAPAITHWQAMIDAALNSPSGPK